ncbi:hypothetical protein [Nocardia brevicatena]|uniref:hypothetical protein n=1 Tax=Nocardia brevicatena TaxID=37327 RepID=UPI0012F9423C|nr:hypothetical protein [Nocardia brevicatena]
MTGEPLFGGMAPRLLCKAAEQIAGLLDTGARSIHNGIEKFTGRVRCAGNDASNADEVGADVVNRQRSGFGVTDIHGTSHNVLDVRVDRLIDHEGRTNGIYFPTRKAEDDRPADEEAFPTWARMPNRWDETEYFPEHRVTPTDGREPYWADSGSTQPTPWADEAGDGMLYVQAHAGPNGFDVGVNAGTR